MRQTLYEVAMSVSDIHDYIALRAICTRLGRNQNLATKQKDAEDLRTGKHVPPE